MHDTLNYFKREPIHRKYHQDNITFSMVYAFSENFILPLSHDEVVHGKGSIIRRMPGDEWQRFANLRALYSYMFTHPGGKLLFMGNEIAQYDEWNFKQGIQWNLLEYNNHKGIQTLIKDLNHLYISEPALYQYQYEQKGFEWMDFSDHEKSIISYLRKGEQIEDTLLIICNFDAKVHENYSVGVPARGDWEVIFNSDHTKYGGTGSSINSSFESVKSAVHGRMFSIRLNIIPLGVLVLKMKS
jgi:1,4-alpha-glucan branching enzyme